MARLLETLILLISALAVCTRAQDNGVGSAAAATAAPQQQPCLSTGEAYNIALRWLQIFQTDLNGTGTGAVIVPSTLTSNFTVRFPTLSTQSFL